MPMCRPDRSKTGTLHSGQRKTGVEEPDQSQVARLPRRPAVLVGERQRLAAPRYAGPARLGRDERPHLVQRHEVGLHGHVGRHDRGAHRAGVPHLEAHVDRTAIVTRTPSWTVSSVGVEPLGADLDPGLRSDVVAGRRPGRRAVASARRVRGRSSSGPPSSASAAQPVTPPYAGSTAAGLDDPLLRHALVDVRRHVQPRLDRRHAPARSLAARRSGDPARVGAYGMHDPRTPEPRPCHPSEDAPTGATASPLIHRRPGTCGVVRDELAGESAEITCRSSRTIRSTTGRGRASAGERAGGQPKRPEM